jgi:hypothetical protein
MSAWLPAAALRRAGIGLGVLCALLMVGSVAHAQPDSVRAALLEKRGYPPHHSPRGALWRAAAVPGWGQFYNRQYYKMPFVYAGLAGGAYAIYEMNRRYRLFRRANLYVIGRSQADESGGDNPYGQFRGDYDEAVVRLGGDPESSSVGGRQLRDQRDQYRRWRDLSILGTGLFYALTVLDAYVSAHLLTFDVGGDLALSVRPTGGVPRRADGRPLPQPLPQYEETPPEGRLPANGLGVHLRVRF